MDSTVTNLRLEDHFIKGSALGFLKRRHPYDFIETYQFLRSAYNYQSYYVNLGLWEKELLPDSEKLDAAERLVKFLCHKSGITTGQKLLDVGSGLGQSAIHYVEWLEALQVIGLNHNERQIGFANTLARSLGLEAKISHIKLDACSGFESNLGKETFDGIFAVECIGHFKRPENFLKSVYASLKPGGVYVCCMNVMKNELSFALKSMFKTTYGFAPEARSAWTERIAQSGLQLVDEGDITEAVLGKGTRSVLQNVDSRESSSEMPWLSRKFIKIQLSLVLSGVARGELGYVWMVARKN